MNEILIPNATLYAARFEIELGEALGSGKDGIVLVGKHKAHPAKVALKALRWSEAYEREKSVYGRLRQTGASSVLGFNVPQLIGQDDGLRVLEMTIVERPFVLDFASAHLDSRPEFPGEVWPIGRRRSVSSSKTGGQWSKRSWRPLRRSESIYWTYRLLTSDLQIEKKGVGW
jgi:hypothetical protein